ncbi:DUF167 domain-containing protein [Aspergillus lucknowensis]|uniref:DUF167-domain-containing protein n=1 Tax=Aspergillus lucknowensis TaxID=176173 RepID=A0ABR4LM70_9EURO
MSRPFPVLRLIQTATSPRNKTQDLAKRYNLQISCKVKANAPGNREGIAAVGPEKVEVCVAAAPRNGEANAAVSRVFAQVFNVAKSDVGVVHGLKSRDKILNVVGLNIGNKSEEEFLWATRHQLEEAVMKK